MIKFKGLLALLGIFFSLALAVPVNAADLLSRIIGKDQYALVVGKVTKVLPTSFQLSDIRVISGHRLPTRIVIKCAATDQPKSGEKLLISLKRENSNYQIHWGLFHVSSLNPKKLAIINSKWPQGDLAALEHYLHTNGVENDFFFIADSAFVRKPDETFTRIYPKLPAKQRAKHFKLMICPEQQNYDPTYSVKPGLGLYAVYYHGYEGTEFCWQTNYGQFIRCKASNSGNIDLGMTANVPGWERIYWVPSATQQTAPPDEIKITLTVKDQKSKRQEYTCLLLQPAKKGFKILNQ